MAKKGNRRHVKSLNAPKYFGVYRKFTAYVIKPKAGRHTLDKSVAITLFMKFKGLTKTTKEAKKIINAKNVLVNGKVVTDIKYPVGLNDVITLANSNESYLVGIDSHGRASFDKTDKEVKERTYKIIRKYKTKKGKVMFGLHDGSLIPGGKEANVSDSVKLDLKNKVTKVLPLSKGAKCLVIEGVHTGATGMIKDIKAGSMKVGKIVLIEQEGGSAFETLVRNIMVV